MFRTRGPNDFNKWTAGQRWKRREHVIRRTDKGLGQSGFQVDFPNGWTASVQWGAGTYSDNYDARIEDDVSSSTTAEIWAMETEGEGRYPQDPKGRQTMNQVRNFLEEVSIIKDR